MVFHYPTYTSKSKLKSNTLFNVKDLFKLTQKGVELSFSRQSINHTWTVVVVTNGDGTVRIKRYSREIQPSKFGGSVIEDNKRNITTIRIDLWSIIRTDVNPEFPFEAEIQACIDLKVTNPQHIFTY